MSNRVDAEADGDQVGGVNQPRDEEEGAQYEPLVLETKLEDTYGKEQYRDLLEGPRLFRQFKSRNADNDADVTTTKSESGLVQWVAKVHRKGLIQYFRRKSAQDYPYAEYEANVGFVMSLAELQRMRMRKLQAHLIYDVTELRFHGEASGWEAHLDEYVKSLQDYEYMVKTQNKKDDPFLVTSERLFDRILVRKAMERFDAGSIQITPVPRTQGTAPAAPAAAASPPPTPASPAPAPPPQASPPQAIPAPPAPPTQAPPAPPAPPPPAGEPPLTAAQRAMLAGVRAKQNSLQRLENSLKKHLVLETKGGGALPFYYNPDPICKPRDQLLEQFYTARVLFAGAGSLFLLAPMWIMVLHNTLWTGLATTTAFVCVFAFLAAWRLTTTNEVIAATAAYTAVLVVFVGVNTS